MRDHGNEFDALDVKVVGISPDPPSKQKSFDGRYGLGFDLLSDEDHSVSVAYGAWGQKSLLGMGYEGMTRSSILIDEEGRVVEVWYDVSPKETASKAIEVLSQ